MEKICVMVMLGLVLSACSNQAVRSQRLVALNEKGKIVWQGEKRLTYCLPNVVEDFNFELSDGGHWSASFRLLNLERHDKRPRWHNALTLVFADKNKKRVEGSKLLFFELTVDPHSLTKITQEGDWLFGKAHFLALSESTMTVLHQCDQIKKRKLNGQSSD